MSQETASPVEIEPELEPASVDDLADLRVEAGRVNQETRHRLLAIAGDFDLDRRCRPHTGPSVDGGVLPPDVASALRVELRDRSRRSSGLALGLVADHRQADLGVQRHTDRDHQHRELRMPRRDGQRPSRDVHEGPTRVVDVDDEITLGKLDLESNHAVIGRDEA
ncbi:MAG: hypothetical protein GWO04_01915 [Actinobacteria bacterium]|nr:hypothetical protein [Actinomycetota bacterium]